VIKELIGTDMENIPKGMQMVIVSFFFFFHQKYKSTHHILQLLQLRFDRSRAVVLLQLCSPSSVEQLSAPDGSLSFVVLFCFCRDREFDNLKTNDLPKIQ